MLITLLCPEYVTWIAFEQWQRARRHRDVCQLKNNDLTMQHGFYVNMGGLQVLLERQGADSQVAKVHHDIVELGNGMLFTIRLEDLILLLKADVLPLHDIQIHDLEERSKSDKFARVVTSIQALYFVVNSVGRVGSRLLISPLEVSSLAFICCAAFVEFFWWNKPLDLRSATLTTLSPDKHVQLISIFPKLRFNTQEEDLA